MSEQLKQNILIAIVNTVRISLFVVLAIVFGKWWISLFSILFLVFTKDK